MSFQAIAWAVRQKLPCTQKIVLVMLADRHNSDTGRCDPSHDRLAGDCGLTRRSVMDQLAKLDKAGFIRTHHRVIDKLKTSNQYTLMLSFGAPADVKEFHIDVQQVPVVVNDVHQGSEPVAHKPVKEPVKNLNTNTRADAPATVRADAAIAKPAEVSQEVWGDFLSLRKEKRAKLTKTALAGIQREADKAGWALENALTESCARGWTGFKAEWVADKAAASAMTASRSSGQTNRHAGAAAAIWGNSTQSHGDFIDV